MQPTHSIETALPMLDTVAFVFGACVGSFLNVVVWRLPRHESLLSPPSHCPHCNHRLRPWENVPILAWIFLRARCSSCRNRISVRYPLVEALVAIIFFLLWRRTLTEALPLYSLFPAFFLAGTVIAAGIIDLEHRIIPDRLLAPALLAAIVFSLLWPTASLAAPPRHPAGWLGLAGIGNQPLADWIPPYFLQSAVAVKNVLLGAVGAGVFMLAIRKVGRLLWGRTAKRAPTGSGEVLGLGDVKLLIVVGAFVGPDAIVAVIFIASLLGTLAGAAMLAFSRMRRGWSLPYAPYIAAATILWLLAETQLFALIQRFFIYI